VLGATTPPVLTAAETASKIDFCAPNKNSAPSPASAADALVQALDVAAMDNPGKAAIGTASFTNVMSNHAPDCFVLLSADQIKNLVFCSTAAAAASALSIRPALPPKMTAVLASTSASSSSYFGTLDFLHSQFAFDAIFPSPVPLLVAPPATSASVDSILLLASLIAFVNRCKFQLIVPIFRCDYVGAANCKDAASLHAAILALKRPTMSYRHPTSGHWIHLTPTNSLLPKPT
jgi:hypothetical protein